jgi:ketosteroid isomerase-like protein
MSQENVEIVKAIFAAWQERNPRAALEHIDRDIEVDFTGHSGGSLSRIDVVRGAEGLQKMLSDWLADFGSLEFHPQSYIDAGDNVIVWLRTTARGRKSGVPVEDVFAVIYTLRDGRVIRFRGYETLAAATSDLGI